MGIITLLMVVGLILLIPTAYAGKIGAPYAPTFSKAIRKAFDYINLNKEDTLIDLGAGDGRVLIEAHRRGASAIGYELSPIMWFVTLVLILIRGRQKGIAKPHIYLRNFYKQKLPEKTTVIFTFLMPENMNHVKEYLSRQNLPNAKYMVVYAFPFKDVKPINVVKAPNCSAAYIYNLREIINHQNKDNHN